MAHRAGSGCVTFTKILSTAVKWWRAGVRAPLLDWGIVSGKLWSLNLLPIESEKKSLIIKWHSCYSWQEAGVVVVLDNTVAIPGCGQRAGFWADGLDALWLSRHHLKHQSEMSLSLHFWLLLDDVSLLWNCELYGIISASSDLRMKLSLEPLERSGWELHGAGSAFCQS